MIFTLNFHEFLHTVYKYVLTSVVKISLMFTQYFEYYAIILRGGGVFSWTHYRDKLLQFVLHQKQNRLYYMWTNAQRDGRPAEYRWCSLFNAAKFG